MVPPPSPPPPPDPSEPHNLSEMEISSHLPIQTYFSSSPWDWSEFLDFGLDDGQLTQLNSSLDSDQPPVRPQLPPPQIEPYPELEPARIRKRDPRLTCPNYIARVPCSCPELDDDNVEAEEGLPEKKRVRSTAERAAAAKAARCQVPVCGSDISELKGYHKRHRICLRCANASAVVLEGLMKRYCQQCGKFHILSDFDEGKRSCRRKLERHNNRRRRKPCKSRVVGDKEPHRVANDAGCDNENGKDSVCLSSLIAEKALLLEPEEGQMSRLCSNPCSENNQNDSGVSLGTSDEAQIVGEKDEYKHAHLSSYCDDKITYSSMCPTGRISFKLYDWNPAEFPRRLRHQIFQWLASMPVELEGYIRPGCTILTVFIAMPSFMWARLLDDPFVRISRFVAAPGNMLSGRGNILVYLDNVPFRAVKDGSSVMQVKVEEQAPKLHYVRPSCFEAGKPMEIMACGSNLLHPKFRFLVSFAGKYLSYDYCAPCGKFRDTEEVAASSDHQLLKIYVPHTEPDNFGPAFIEVENESGLSNFIPILIGNKEICSEMNILEKRFESSLCLTGSKFMTTSSYDACDVSVLRQSAFSQLVVDTAWLLRKPEDLQHILTLSQIERFNRLLTFLIDNKSTNILDTVVQNIETMIYYPMLDRFAHGVADTGLKLLENNLEHVREILLCQRLERNGDSVQHSGNLVQKGDCFYSITQTNTLSVTFLNQEIEEATEERRDLDARVRPNSQDQSVNIPLLSREVSTSTNHMKEKPVVKLCRRVSANKYLSSRPLIFVIAVAAVCFGVCVAVLHPQKVGIIATTIRRCLFNIK